MPNKLVVIGCSCGGSEALGYLLPRLELQDSSLIISSHIESSEIYDSISSQNKILLKGQEEEMKPGFTYIIEYGFFGVAERLLLGLGRYETIEINERNIKWYINKFIDGIMEAAAEGYGKNCIGVILSGSGDDGSDGLKRIKSKKGTTLVQIEEDSSYYDKFCYNKEMALAALEKTDVDFKGPLPELANELNNYLATK